MRKAIVYINQLTRSIFLSDFIVVDDHRNQIISSFVLFFGLGSAAFFILHPDCDWKFLAGLLLVFSVSAFIFRNKFFWALGLFLLAGFSTGLLCAALQLASGPTRILSKPLYSAEVRGEVLATEPYKNRERVIVHPVFISGMGKRHYDWNVRLVLGKGQAVKAGEKIHIKARLFPLPPPGAPGDPDFARRLFFDNIGAVGSASGPLLGASIDNKENKNNLLSKYFNVFYESIHRGLSRHLSGDRLGLAEALILGKRGGISDELSESLRRSGLAHLLAISGLHMGLLSGIVFFVIRYVLACYSPIALRYPIKKYAAVAAIFAGAFYLALSGATIPTQRAFIMLLAVWIGVLTDRRAITLRLVSIAALGVMVIDPVSVISPGFQLSFAAVCILVVFYEGPGKKLFFPDKQTRWGKKVFLYFSGLLATGILVTAVSAPIISYHFGRLTVWGIISNLGAIPVMAFWVMPLIVLSIFLIPLGAGGVVLWLMTPGLDALIAIAHFFGKQNWGIWHSSGGSFSLTLAIMIGGAWLAIWRRHWLSWAAVLIILLGSIAQIRSNPENILIADHGRSWGVYDQQSKTLFVSQNLSDFRQSVWSQRFGLEPSKDGQPNVMSCDHAICDISVDGQHIVITSDNRPVGAGLCKKADLVVYLGDKYRPSTCQPPTKNISGKMIRRDGGVAIALHKDKAFALRTVRETYPWPWIQLGKDMSN